ncbi:MAG: acyloxyacyl hydrolase [Rubellimicrobium sp.]|nr:acyloxyacyl hydrolase [Rubellimicrobium sp.]
MFGLLGLLFFGLSVRDMMHNHCPDPGCLAPVPRQAELSLQPGRDYFQSGPIGQELFVTFAADHSHGPYVPLLGASISGEVGSWIGAGVAWRFPFGPLEGQVSLMPGIQTMGATDVGGPVLFRSSVSLGYRFDSGALVSLVIDHRSNLDLREVNPGVESLALRLTLPLD